MIVRKQRRKLLYPPGLITLSVLSLLFCHFVYYEWQRKELLHVIEVTYWDPNHPYGSVDPLKLVNGRFKKIVLTGSETDELRLEFARDLIRDLMRKKYPAPGIEITFGDGAKYASLIRLLDICETENVKRYMNYQNKFWIFSSAIAPETAKLKRTSAE
jgi:hypothetical protein